MKNKPNKLWIVVFALGWLFDFLFWKKEPGISFAIFAAACMTAAFYLLLSDGLRPNRASLTLLPIFGFFVAVTTFRSEPMTIFLAYTFSLLCMMLLAFTYLGGRWHQYTFADYIGKTLQLAGSMLARPILFTNAVRKEQADSDKQNPRSSIWPVVRGIIIALPVIAVFASLLASADAIFDQRLNSLIEWFNIENLPELIFRLVYIVVIGYALAGIVLHAAVESTDEKIASEGKPLVPAFLGYVEAMIVLGGVVILFLTFVVIQFQYFFGGQANITIDGYTYAEYARRGFGELVTVAFFALLMLQVLSGITKRETDSQRKVFSGLGIALVALLMFMLLSAYQRLGLYESVYGFSRLRTYTHVFLVWIGLLLIATIALEVTRRERAFSLAVLIASIGFAASLAVLNVDTFIVNQNIQRELKEGNESNAALDAHYFIALSDDAIPAVVKAFKSDTLPASQREQLGATLACIQDRRNSNEHDESWQSFHFSRFNADKALAQIANDLKSYPVEQADDYSKYATTPSGEEFSCYAERFD